MAACSIGRLEGRFKVPHRNVVKIQRVAVARSQGLNTEIVASDVSERGVWDGGLGGIYSSVRGVNLRSSVRNVMAPCTRLRLSKASIMYIKINTLLP